MAFTEAQKVSIRRYLGYPLGWYDLNTRLESMIDKVGSNAVEQAAVETILTELATIDGVLATAGATAQTMGSLAQVDEVRWHEITEESKGVPVDALSRGKNLIERLRQCFGVPLAGRYFGTAPPYDGQIALG